MDYVWSIHNTQYSESCAWWRWINTKILQQCSSSCTKVDPCSQFSTPQYSEMDLTSTFPEYLVVSMSKLRNSGMISSPINNIRKAGLTDCNCRHVVQLCHSISVGVEKSQVEGVFGDDCQEKSLTTWTNVSAWNQHLERYIYTWNVKYDYDSYSHTLQGLW